MNTPTNPPMDVLGRVESRLNTGHEEIIELAKKLSEKTGKPVEECVTDAITALAGGVMREVDLLFLLREGEKAQCRQS